MTASTLLLDLFSRPAEVALTVLSGLDSEGLNYRPAPGANSIGWLLWHLAREQDVQIAPHAGVEEAWIAGDYDTAFGLGPGDMGYGQAPEEAAAIRFDDPALLRRYLLAVAELVNGYLAKVSDDDVDLVIDDAWDPPVTLGVRLISAADDAAQHAGQAAYLKGLL